MPTITETILEELLAAAGDPAALAGVFQRRSMTKGPFYAALAQATAILERRAAELGEAAAGLEQRRQELAAQVESLAQEPARLALRTATARAEAERWEAEAGAAAAKTRLRLSAIRAAERLLAAGVKPGDLVAWSRIVQLGGVEPEAVAQALQVWGAFRAIVAAQREENRGLAAETLRLSGEVRRLKAKREGLLGEPPGKAAGKGNGGG